MGRPISNQKMAVRIPQKMTFKTERRFVKKQHNLEIRAKAMNREALQRYQKKGNLKKSPKKTRRTRNGFESGTEEIESDKKTMTFSEKFPIKKVSRVFLIEQQDIKIKEPEFLNILT